MSITLVTETIHSFRNVSIGQTLVVRNAWNEESEPLTILATNGVKAVGETKDGDFKIIWASEFHGADIVEDVTEKARTLVNSLSKVALSIADVKDESLRLLRNDLVGDYAPTSLSRDQIDLILQAVADFLD